MTLSISTFGLYNMLMSSAKNAQSAVATATTQESTGLVGTDFASLGGKARQLLNMQTEISQTQTYASITASASDRVQAMYSAIGNMTTLLTNLRSAISAGMSGTSTASLVATGQSTLADLASQMNAQLSGRYLFSGSQTDTPAVDLGSYPSVIPPNATTPDTGYYKGDAQISTVKVSTTTTISYGVTGDNSAFEQALRAASMVAGVTTSPLDTDTLQAAYDLADKAITALSNLQATVSTTASRLSDIQQDQSSYITLLTDAASNIKNVDAAEAMAKVTQLQTQLQASYSALSVVMKIRLTDYL